MHASVYQCFLKEDTEQKSPFAVKVSREDDEEKKQAHKKEFDITKHLRHTNVIKSIELFDNDITGEIHQVMEFIEGKEVLDSIAEQEDGHYTEDMAKELF